MKTECRVERYQVDGTHQEQSVAVDESSIGDFVDLHRDSWSATLWIPGIDQEMAVSLSSGAVAVTLRSGEDDFYDLVADERQQGWVNFVHGGQPANHPRRHCVTPSDATAYAAAFLREGSISLPDAGWERQEQHQTA